MSSPSSGLPERRISLHGVSCPQCHQAKLQDAQKLCRVSVNGKHGLAYVIRSVCPNCGESTISASEIRRAEDAVRVARKRRSGKLILRMDPSLHALIVGRTVQTERSLNEEILYLIEKALGVDAEDLQTEPWKVKAASARAL